MTSDDFEREWRRWRARREARLREPDGWLALVGLHWLEDGEQPVPGLPGLLRVQGGAVTLAAGPGDGWWLDGEPLAGERRLETDRDGRPDRLRNGGRTAVVIERGGRLALRVWDGDAPARRAFRGVPAFQPDPGWRITARWEPLPTPRAVEITSTVGTTRPALVPGVARFERDGRTLSLEPTQERSGLLFVFRDATAGAETYGAGRMLEAAPAADGIVVLDFNHAINPPCAFTPLATCPLPRPENVLPVRIEAGERAYEPAPPTG